MASETPRRYQFHLGAGLPAPMVVGLSRVIGVRRLKADAAGREYIDFPYPFHELRIYQRETLSADKRTRLAEAIAYFDAHAVSSSRQ